MVFTKTKSCQRDMLLSNLKEISAGTDCKFPYGGTMLHAYLVKIRPILVAWRYKYLIKVQKYREDGYLIAYLYNT